MSENEQAHSRYHEARRNFDDLDVEERARFLVEATASTLAHGLLQAGEALAEGLEDAVRQARKRAARSSEARGPGAAEPETAQRQAPRNGSHDSDEDPS
jgi:hypothetical protein